MWRDALTIGLLASGVAMTAAGLVFSVSRHSERSHSGCSVKGDIPMSSLGNEWSKLLAPANARSPFWSVAGCQTKKLPANWG